MENVNLSAGDKAFVNAISKFDLKTFKSFLKKWDKKGYDVYKRLDTETQTRLLAKNIIKYKEYTDNEIVEKAERWLNNHPDKIKRD